MSSRVGTVSSSMELVIEVLEDGDFSSGVLDVNIKEIKGSDFEDIAWLGEELNAAYNLYEMFFGDTEVPEGFYKAVVKCWEISTDSGVDTIKIQAINYVPMNNEP